MLLIADSGSTKTDWRLVEGDKKIQVSTQGLNPYFLNSENIQVILQQELLPHLTIDSSHSPEIFFYGAGCSAGSKKEIVKQALNALFPKSTIEIHSDLLGAARAVCGNEPGIAAILGTGSNTCYYNGTAIIENRASLGYVLGDEGSGAHIGKTFIQAYLNEEMPKELAARFYQRFQLSTADILDAVYKKPMPNRFLASFSKFIYQNLKEQFVVDMVIHCFEQFFDKHICKYPKHKELKLSCVGSVGFYYSNILRGIALRKGVAIDKIIETPIAGLTLYHNRVEGL